MHSRFHRAGSLFLASLIVAAGSALAAPQAQKPAPPPVPEEPTPAAPGPNDRTETIPVSAYLISTTTSSVLKAITQATGARASFLGATQSVVLTGTKEQLAQAKTMIVELTQQATVQAQSRQAEQQAYADSMRTPRESSGGGEITLEFPGGTVAQYLAAVGKAGAFDGFLVQDSALLTRIQMPSLKLRNVSLRTAIDALTRLPLPGPEDLQYTIGLSWVGPASQGNARDTDDSKRVAESICVIQAQQSKRDSRNAATRAVFDLSGLQVTPKKEGVQQLLDAVSIAVELDGKSSTFRAKYHEPSQLLIVQGTNEELSLVRQVLKARLPDLREDSPKEESKADATPQPAAPQGAPQKPKTGR